MPPSLAGQDTLQTLGEETNEAFLQVGPDEPSRTSRIWRWSKATVHHLRHHVGVGIICSVAYFDPPKHRRLIRYTVLYPLYALCEIAIISTDLAELLGSAIGLCLIFPTLPLWAGVLITASDVLVFLLLGDPSSGQRRSVKIFEFTVIALVFAVFACFVVLLVRVKPHWPAVFLGYIPSETLFETRPNALYTAVGILGATVMPHALFLGSFLATRNRLAEPLASLPEPASALASTSFARKVTSSFKSLFEVSRLERKAAARDYRDKYGRENNNLDFIQAHLRNGLVDVVFSLLAIAVPINSAILVIAATVFHRKMDSSSSAGLFDAYDLIKDHVGKAAAFVFALALLCSGQTASITATLAGQVVSEGFIEWRISPFLRRILTRILGLIPSMAVAIAVGRSGLDTLLVASQVVLSIVLPFVVFPLIYLTSSKSIMRVRKPIDSDPATPMESPTISSQAATSVVITEIPVDGEPGSVLDGLPPHIRVDEKSIVCITEEKREKGPQVEDHHDEHDAALSPSSSSTMEVPSSSEDGVEYIDYSNGWITIGVVSLIFLVVLAANVYVIVALALGQT
ncbi:hypothetical protein EIP91_002387 [Steccherinum ochraceum]|uniref:Uncharacterized protein n=1 Tax=Steccherinum ochraceum TaxID=92696 RepID=A0A4R0RS50_9APHY|nr:hypothetical protein EIP91_002387 [Steccherinum ochraceum]